MFNDFMLSELVDALHKTLVAAAPTISVYDADLASIAIHRLEQATAIIHGYRRMPHWPADYDGWTACNFQIPTELAEAAAAFMQRVRMDNLPW